MKTWPFPAASEQVPAFRAGGINPTSTALSNKLFVMIDGRTVYTPLKAGANLEANAVNGFIDIVALIAVSGRNLPEESHVENRHGFGPPQQDVSRSVYARVA